MGNPIDYILQNVNEPFQSKVNEICSLCSYPIKPGDQCYFNDEGNIVHDFCFELSEGELKFK